MEEVKIAAQAEAVAAGGIDTIPQKPQRTRKHKKYRDGISGLLMALPPIIGFALFSFIPQLISLWLSFQTTSGYDFSSAKFIGFGNFTDILSDRLFYLAIGNTIFYMIPTFICIGMGLLIAVLLSNRGLRGKKFFRSIFFIPYVCSVVATTIMWYWIFNEENGILNSILGTNVLWFSEEWPFRFALCFMLVWSGCGYNTILYQSALAAVDQTLYEAAEIDGANSWQKFAHITWPSIMPTTFFMIVMGVIHGLQAFTTQQIWGEKAGSQGPNHSALTAVYFIYQRGFRSSQYGLGYASAASWLLAIIIGIVTVINFKLKGRRKDV